MKSDGPIPVYFSWQHAALRPFFDAVPPLTISPCHLPSFAAIVVASANIRHEHAMSTIDHDAYTTR